MRFKAVACLLPVLFSPLFASGEIKIPDINIFANDLSIYGIPGMELQAAPQSDKEKYIFEKKRAKNFPLASSFGRACVISVSAANKWFDSASAAYENRHKSADVGARAGFSTAFLGETGRRSASENAELFYRSHSPAGFEIAPGFFRRSYETPGTGGANYLGNYFETSAGVNLGRGSFFTRLKAEPVIYRALTPPGVYVSGSATSIESVPFSVKTDFLAGGLLARAEAGYSGNNWSWPGGGKRFESSSAGLSLSSDEGPVGVDSSLKYRRRAGKTYYLAGLAVNIPAGKSAGLRAGIMPRYEAPGIESVTYKKGVVVKTFPAAAHDNYKNFFIKYFRTDGPLAVSLRAERRDTLDYLYADESSPAYGIYRRRDFRRGEFSAEAAWEGGSFSASLKGSVKKYSGEVIVPRRMLALYVRSKKSRLGCGLMLEGVSKTAWVGSYIRNSLKIWYNLKKNFKLFFAADNPLNEKVYGTRYEPEDCPVFSVGAEKKF